MKPLSQKIVVACLACKSLYRVPVSLTGKPVTCKKCRRTFLASEANLKQSNPEEEGFLLCKIALNYGFVTENTLEHILSEYARLKHTGHHVTMETLFKSHGRLDDDTVQLLKSIRENWDLRIAEKQFAQEAVKKGFIDHDTARNALIRQAQLFKVTRKVRLLCDILTESGCIHPGQCDEILKERVPFPLPSLPADDTRKDAPSPPELAKSPPPLSSSENQPKGQQDTQQKKSIPSKVPETEAPHEIPVPSAPSAASKTEPPIMKKDVASSAPAPAKENKQTDKHPPKIPVKPPISKSSPVETSPLQTSKQTKVEDVLPDAAPSPEPLKDGPKDPQTLPLKQDEYANGIFVQGLELIISDDCLTATLRVPEGIDPKTVPVEAIKDALAQEEIVFGVSDDSLIKGFLNSKIFREKPFKIAEGRLPRHGKKGSIKFYFDTDYLKIGKITNAGTIDFKNRGEIPYVTEGTLLAEITPSVQGEHGTDIRGRDIPIELFPDVYLRCDSGTRQTEDGKVYASINGQPKLHFGNRLQVLSDLTIQGDVGFETGHVEFEGNIVIKGAVQNDFIVRGANVKANEITGATIIAKGDLDVKNGISNSKLNIEGNIHAKFIHNCTISAYGNVVAEKEMIDCEIDCSGICSVEKGKIISSSIASKLGVEAQDIGTELSKPCKIKIGVDDHIQKEIDGIEDNVLEHKTILAGFEQTLKELEEKEKNTHKVIASLAHVQDRSQLEQKALVKLIKELETAGDAEGMAVIKQQIDELDQKARDADRAINESFDEQERVLEEIKKIKEQIIDQKDHIIHLNGQRKDKKAWVEKIKGIAYVKTSKNLQVGTVISGVYATKTIKETIRNARIREVKSVDSPDGWEIKMA